MPGQKHRNKFTVVDSGVCQVVSQVLNGALASDNGLDKESEHREHCLQQQEA